MFDALVQWVSSQVSSLTDALVYIAIAGVTLIGVFKCLIPLLSTTHALRRAISMLQHDAGSRQGTPVWQEKRFMGNHLKNCWLRFLQNAEQLDRRGLPCNVEDYINDDTVTHGPGNAQLADLIPGLLTSLGILGTFMGMMDGLGGLDLTNADKIIDSIPTLLTGMQFAFGTSVAGVTCSISFNIINRILQGSSYRAIDDFVSNFTTLAMSRPLDNDVQLICQNQDSNHMLSTLTDTLPGQLAGAMEMSACINTCAGRRRRAHRQQLRPADERDAVRPPANARKDNDGNQSAAAGQHRAGRTLAESSRSHRHEYRPASRGDERCHESLRTVHQGTERRQKPR